MSVVETGLISVIADEHILTRTSCHLLNVGMMWAILADLLSAQSLN